jgi:predicted dehydrogenase
MSSPLRVGVIGVGSLGQWHAKVYAALESVQFVGIYDENHERGCAVAAQYGTRAFANLQDLLPLIQAASVVVPTVSHFRVASQLLQRGIHVLVEKPITDNEADAEELVRLAAERGVVLQVGHVERYNPVMAFLEQHLTRPRFIEAIRLAPFPPPRAGAMPRGTEVSVVLDLMIHDLEIILHLVRSPLKSMHAVGVPVLSTSEDIANTRLVFENGCVANVTASRVSQESLRKIRVFQPDTYVSLDYQAQAGKLLRRSGTGIETQDVPIARGDALTHELAEFAQCVMTHAQPRVSGHQGFAALKLATEICRQARQGGAADAPDDHRG